MTQRLMPLNLYPLGLLHHFDFLRITEQYYDRTYGSRRQELLAEWGLIPGTDVEDKTALALCAYIGLPPTFTQQHKIGSYRADFAIPDAKVVIEVDGFMHGTDWQRARDRMKDDKYAAAGWTVYRIDCTKNTSGPYIGWKVAEIVSDVLTNLGWPDAPYMDEDKLLLDAHSAIQTTFSEYLSLTKTKETQP